MATFSPSISQSTVDRLNILYGTKRDGKFSSGTNSLIIALLTFKFGRASYLFHEKMENGGVQAVADNLEGVAVFVLSRMWSDLLIAVFILGYHAIPYCGGYIATACTEDASSTKQFIYAFIAIPVAGLLKHLAESSGLTKRPGMYDDIPMILKYIVGWAFGNACTQFVAETKAANPSTSGHLIDFSFTLVLTIVSGLLVVLLLPLTKEIELGTGKLINWIEDLLEDIMDMVARCLDVSIMVMWGYSFSNFVNGSLGDEPFGVKNRTDFFFACAASFVGVLLIVALEQMESQMQKICDQAFEDAKKDKMPIITHWTQHAIAFSNIIQRAISWVAGCAWSDVLFNNAPSLSAAPYLPTILTNFVLVFVITAMSCTLLIARIKKKGESSTAESMADRSAVEASFVSDAMSFFVLGAWLVFVRNIFAPFSRFVEQLVVSVDETFGTSLPTKTGDTVAILVFAPVVTVLFFRIAGYVMRKLAESANASEIPSKAAAEREAKEMMLELKDERRERDIEAESKAKRKLLSDNPSLVVLVLGGKFSLAKELMDYKLENGGLKTVIDFLESAAVFALSRMWSDLISAFIFGLHAIPYCGGYAATECTPEAPSSAQFVYAVCAVPIAGLFKHLAESSGLTSLPGMYDDIPMMLKYIVGWGFGNAFQKFLIEVKEDNPGLCYGDDCTLINVGFAIAATLASAVVIFILRPAAKEIECGDSAVVNWLEDLLEDILQMIIRGAEVVAMVLWYYAAYNSMHMPGTSSTFQESVNIFWACTATFVGALFMVGLESIEQNMEKIKTAAGIPASQSHWTDAVILFSDVIQSCFGFVTGCAWSDWLFETVTVLNAAPTFPVIVTNLIIVCALTVMSCYWLIMSASSEGIEESTHMTEEEKKAKAAAKATDRSEVEKQFFSSALGFFVLGGWLTVTRNLFAPFMILIEELIGYMDETFGLSAPAKVGDLIAVLLYAPVFTVIAFYIAGRVLEGFTKKAGLAEKPKSKTAAAAAQPKPSVEKRTSSRRSDITSASVDDAQARPPTTSLLVALSTCQSARAWELTVFKLQNGGVKTVVDFVESAIVFALSKMWWDLLAAFVFKLTPVPYCEGFIAAPCTEPASANTQFIYALFTIPVTGLLKHLAESTGLTERPGMYDDIPQILKYLVGWAFGGAVKQMLIETVAANPGLCFGDDCTLFNVAFSIGVTIVSAITIIVVQPLSKEIEFGSGKVVDWIEDYLEDTFAMLVRGFTVVVVVIWNYTIGDWVHKGVLADTSPGAAQSLQILWACTATFGGAICMVVIEAFEQSLRKTEEAKKVELEKLGLPVPAKSWQSMMIEFTNLIQGVFGSVAGSAWSSVLFFLLPTMKADPYGAIVFINLGIIIVVTLLACCWLVVSSSTKGIEEPENMTDEEKQKWEDAKATSRETHEKAFMNASLSFLVLGGWTTVFHNVFAFVATFSEAGITFADKELDLQIPQVYGDTIGVFIFAPLFTVLAFKAAEAIMTSLAGVGGIPTPKPAQVDAALEAKQAREVEKTEVYDPAAIKLAKRKLVSENPSLVVLVLGGKFSLAKELMDYKLENGGLKTVIDFLESAAVFALSRMWSDLISAFIFELHAIPYCGGYAATECTPEAPSSAQFVYAVCAVPIAGLLKHLAESSGLTSLPGMYDDIPMMLKYIVGWGFGNAFQKWLIEVKEDNPGLCYGDDCTLINVGFAIAATLASAVVIFILRPAAKEIECGDSAVVNWLEDLLEDILQMIIRGAEVVAMVLWYYAAYNFSHLNASGVAVVSNIDIFWACTATFLGAIFMVFLESVEQNMARIKAAAHIPESQSHWTDAAILFSDVIQSCFGFVTGCAWSDWLFETVTVLNAAPTFPVIVTNLIIVCALTVMSCYWLIMSASSEGIEESTHMTEEEKKAKAAAKATDRSEVEKQFFSSALGFFVLGGWLTVTRNLFAPFMILIEELIGYIDETFGLSAPAKVGDLIAVLLYAPVFTVIAFYVAGRVLEGFTKKAGVSEPPKGKHAVSETKAKASAKKSYEHNYAASSSKELV